MAVEEASAVGLGMDAASISNTGASTSTPLDSSNVGFKLLKKHGWKEGTGLGIYEQGRLEPVEALIKKNKRGLGADKPKKIMKHLRNSDGEDPKLSRNKRKVISKKMKKMQEFEKRLQEKEFDRAFFREFWPDNV